MASVLSVAKSVTAIFSIAVGASVPKSVTASVAAAATTAEKAPMAALVAVVALLVVAGTAENLPTKSVVFVT